MLLTHYFAIFTIAGMAAVLLYRHRARWQLIALSLLPTAVAGIALLPTSLPNGTRDGQTGFPRFLSRSVYSSSRALSHGGRLSTARRRSSWPAYWRLSGAPACSSMVSEVGSWEEAWSGSWHKAGIPVLAKAGSKDFIISRYLIGAIVPLPPRGQRRPWCFPASASRANRRLDTRVSACRDERRGRVRRRGGAASWERPLKPSRERRARHGPRVLRNLAARPGTTSRRSRNMNPAMGEVEVKQVVLATIQRPDHRPKNDFCWWGALVRPTGPGTGRRPTPIPASSRRRSPQPSTTWRPLTAARSESSAIGPAPRFRSTREAVSVSTRKRDFVEVANDEAVNSVKVLWSAAAEQAKRIGELVGVGEALPDEPWVVAPRARPPSRRRSRSRSCARRSPCRRAMSCAVSPITNVRSRSGGAPIVASATSSARRAIASRSSMSRQKAPSSK